jgi:hypothetical protein
MTQKDKELLLKDLCARLPYEVKVYNEPYTFDLDIFEVNSTISETILEIIKEGWKPYLRPMSSMTEEERKEYNDIVKNTIDFYDCPKSEEICFFIIPIEWLNKHYFDFRSLIEKGLALEAPDGIYNLKEK